MSRRRVLAALAALLLLLALAACGGDDAAAPTGPGDEALPPAGTEPLPPGGFAEEVVELSIEDQETNDIIGTGLFTSEADGSTHVSIFLDFPPEGGGEAEIRGGRCEEPDAEVTHELGALEEGQLDTTVDTGLEDLLAEPHAVWTVGADGQRGCALIAPFGVDLD